MKYQPKNPQRWGAACEALARRVAAVELAGGACRQGGMEAGGAGGEPALPCLSETIQQSGKRGARSRAALAHNVSYSASNNPLGVGFLTLTIGGEKSAGGFEQVFDLDEVGRRWNSIRQRLMDWLRWSHCLVVPERHSSGAWHLHVFGSGEIDISSGYERGRTANPRLRAMWRLLRSRLPHYGFGRHQLEPVKTVGAIGRYLSKYLGKSLQDAPRGARMVRYCGQWGDRMKAAGWGWNGEKSSAFRKFKGAWLSANGLTPACDWAGWARENFGNKWGRSLRKHWNNAEKGGAGIFVVIHGMIEDGLLLANGAAVRQFAMKAWHVWMAMRWNPGNSSELLKTSCPEYGQYRPVIVEDWIAW